MKKAKLIFVLTVGAFLIASLGTTNGVTASKEQLPNFEIVMPWGLDHPRGQIIQSMIENNTAIASKYNFTYTAVGGGPSDRDALVARFLAGDYPDLIIVTQDWYTEFAGFKIWHDFSSDISAWSGDRANWRTDIPAGWWSILDKANGDGTGSNIYALPFFGQSILPYINLNDFNAAGLKVSDVDTMAGFMSAAKTLKDKGKTPFAEVGALSSDIAYMNYMFGSVDNFINSSTDPATVFSWDADKKYGVNGSLNVEGLADYLKLKGEGLVQSTVDTDGGGDVNTIFGAGDASMVLVGPWGTSIFMGDGLKATDFQAIAMPKSSDGVRSTITGGGISMIPTVGKSQSVIDDAATLAQWLLEDENQMKTVDNWLGQSWRIPVRESLKTNAWFTDSGHPERANFIKHIESQAYAFPWGKQHPQWISIHQAVMMPGYRNALLSVEYGKGYTDQFYKDTAQAALDQMAANIQCFYLGGPCVTLPGTSAAVNPTPGFETEATTITFFVIATLALVLRKRKR